MVTSHHIKEKEAGLIEFGFLFFLQFIEIPIQGVIRGWRQPTWK